MPRAVGPPPPAGGSVIPYLCGRCPVVQEPWYAKLLRWLKGTQ